MEQLQSHIWLTASSYMTKYLRISSYIRKPFLCMTLQLLHSEFPYIWGKCYFLFYQCLHCSEKSKWSTTIHTVDKRSSHIYCQYHKAEKSRGCVYFALSAGEDTTTLLVMVDRTNGGGRAPSHRHQAGLNLPSWWNVCQKVAIACVFVLSRFRSIPHRHVAYYMFVNLLFIGDKESEVFLLIHPS